MNHRSAFFICLIAGLTIGQVIGESDLKIQLLKLKNPLTQVKHTCASLSGLPVNEASPRVQKLQSLTGRIMRQIDELPVNSDTFLYTTDNQKLLENTTNLIDEANLICLMALNSRLAKLEDDRENSNLILSLLSIMNKMVQHITSKFQHRLNDWSDDLRGDFAKTAQPMLVEYRQTLLLSLQTIAARMCEVKKSTTYNLGEQMDGLTQIVLISLRDAAGKVTRQLCNEVEGCIKILVPIAKEIDAKAKCL